MSAAQFFQVVLLPQGEFARFLRADAKDKEALLQKLFGTDRFRKVEDWLADRRRATEKEWRRRRKASAELLARIAQAAGSPVPDSAAPDPRPAPGRRPGPRPRGVGRGRARRGRRPRGGQEGRLEAGWTRSAWPSGSPTGSAAAATRSSRKAELEAAAPEISRLRRGQPRRCTPPASKSRPRSAGWKRCAPSPARPTPRTNGRDRRTRATALAEAIDRTEAERGGARPTAPPPNRHVTPPGRPPERCPPPGKGRMPPARRQATAPRWSLSTRGGPSCARRTWRPGRCHSRRRPRRCAFAAPASTACAPSWPPPMTDGSPCPVCGSLDHPDPVDTTSFPPVGRDAEEAAFALASDAALAADEAGQRVAPSTPCSATSRSASPRQASRSRRRPAPPGR